ncbi:hypothetical protein FMEAI12_5340003 [Parafrankia sp. Ea1.12]|nr:hypothetical protein FMEAI12_5340003 [Parafrankia sp. Ea1.12]
MPGVPPRAGLLLALAGGRAALVDPLRAVTSAGGGAGVGPAGGLGVGRGRPGTLLRARLVGPTGRARARRRAGRVRRRRGARRKTAGLVRTARAGPGRRRTGVLLMFDGIRPWVHRPLRTVRLGPGPLRRVVGRSPRGPGVVRGSHGKHFPPGP